MSNDHHGSIAQATPPAVDWHAWLRHWDAQQTAYLPDREGRFHAMEDVKRHAVPAKGGERLRNHGIMVRPIRL